MRALVIFIVSLYHGVGPTVEMQGPKEKNGSQERDSRNKMLTNVTDALHSLDDIVMQTLKSSFSPTCCLTHTA